MSLCSKCKEMTVLYNPETQGEICENCGNVESESTISTSEIQFSKEDSHMLGQTITHEEGMIGGLLVTNGYRSGRNINLDNQAEQRSIVAKKKSLAKTEQLMTNLNVPNQYLTETFAYVCKVADAQFTKEKMMDYVIATCVYCVARKNQLPITFLDMSECLGESIYKLGRKYKKYSPLLDFTVTSADPIDLLEVVLTNLDVDQTLKPSISTLAGRILRIVKSIWIGEGRRPPAITGASIMLSCAVKGIDVSIGKVAEACKMSTISVRERYKEMQNILIQSMSSLPWGKTVTKSNFLKHVETTMKFLETKNKMIQQENQITDLYLPPSFVKSRNEKERKRNKIQNAKERIQSILDNTYQGSSQLDKEDVELQRLLLLGVKEEDILNGNIQNTKPISLDNPLDENVGEGDIPDSKMNEFIKTPLEVKKLRDLEAFQESPSLPPAKRKK